MAVPSRVASLPPLAQVCASVTAAAPQIGSLPHLADLISAFLDVSTLVAPPRAATSGSVRLFQRVGYRLLSENVDAIERNDAFARALGAAIEADDLLMVQTIHALHPEPLEVEAFQLALAYGSLELVQWIVEHRHDRMCCGPGIERLCSACVDTMAPSIGNKDTFRVMVWLIENGVISVSDGSDANSFQPVISGGLTIPAMVALPKSVELVRWCDSKGFLTDAMANKIVRDSLEQPQAGSANVVEYLLTRGFAPPDPGPFVDMMIKASCHPGQEKLVELVLESSFFSPLHHHFKYAPTREGGAKVLQWDQAYEKIRSETGFFGRSSTTRIAGELGHLDTTQWVVHELGVQKIQAVPSRHATEAETLAIFQWLHESDHGRWDVQTMDLAAAYGYLSVVQWLHENRTERCSTGAMDYAAGDGHLDVVQWLHANRTEGCTQAAANIAAANGHLAIVAWLFQNGLGGNGHEAMAYAAVNGQLHVVQWCLVHGGCAACVQRQLLQQPSNATRLAGFGPRFLYSLEWLDKYAGSSSVACTGQCLNTQGIFSCPNLAADALVMGDMLLLEYLHKRHSELFAWPPDEIGEVTSKITAQGHVAPLQWLYARYPRSLSWRRVFDLAEQRDHTHVVAWLQTLPPSVLELPAALDNSEAPLAPNTNEWGF